MESMATEDCAPLDPLQEIEQRLAVKFMRYFLASLGTVVALTVAVASFKTQVDADQRATESRLANIELTVSADAPFKAQVQADIAVLKSQGAVLDKAIDRMDNKLDRVIRVFDVPK